MSIVFPQPMGELTGPAAVRFWLSKNHFTVLTSKVGILVPLGTGSCSGAVYCGLVLISLK